MSPPLSYRLDVRLFKFVSQPPPHTYTPVLLVLRRHRRNSVPLIPLPLVLSCCTRSLVIGVLTHVNVHIQTVIRFGFHENLFANVFVIIPTKTILFELVDGSYQSATHPLPMSVWVRFLPRIHTSVRCFVTFWLFGLSQSFSWPHPRFVILFSDICFHFISPTTPSFLRIVCATRNVSFLIPIILISLIIGPASNSKHNYVPTDLF